MTDTNVIKLARPGTLANSLTEILRDGAAYPASRRPSRRRSPSFLGVARSQDRGAGPAPSCATGSARARDHDRHWAGGRAPAPGARPRGHWGRADSGFSPSILSTLRAAHEEPRSADPDPLLERRLDRVLRGGAGTLLLGQDARGLSASSIARLKRGLVQRARPLARPRPVRQAVCLRLGRWHLRPGPARNDAQCLMVIIGATAEGKKELVGLADRHHPRECAILEGAAARSQAARPDDLPAARCRRRGARLLEGDR